MIESAVILEWGIRGLKRFKLNQTVNGRAISRNLIRLDRLVKDLIPDLNEVTAFEFWSSDNRILRLFHLQVLIARLQLIDRQQQVLEWRNQDQLPMWTLQNICQQLLKSHFV